MLEKFGLLGKPFFFEICTKQQKCSPRKLMTMMMNHCQRGAKAMNLDIATKKKQKHLIIKRKQTKNVKNQQIFFFSWCRSGPLIVKDHLYLSLSHTLSISLSSFFPITVNRIRLFLINDTMDKRLRLEKNQKRFEKLRGKKWEKIWKKWRGNKRKNRCINHNCEIKRKKKEKKDRLSFKCS